LKTLNAKKVSSLETIFLLRDQDISSSPELVS